MLTTTISRLDRSYNALFLPSMLNNFWQRFIPSRRTAQLPEQACFWSVDMHSHLIPNLDDGVSDPEETLICLKQLADWGIRKVITTPHISQDLYPNGTKAIRQGLTTVLDYIAKYQLPLVVDVAAEYLLDDLFLNRLHANDLLSFGDKRYLLVEAGWASPDYLLTEKLVSIQTSGYAPVLAHPERYAYYHQQRKTLAHLREMGCLFQLNWMSLNGRYGPQVERQARYLLQQRWIDFIGSDIHRPGDLRTMRYLFNSSDLALLEKQPLLNATLDTTKSSG